MLLQKALKGLAASAEAQNLRLWGKIKGTQKDYYIIEGVSNQGSGESEDPAMEPRGAEGINKFAYWVANTPAGPFTVLPDLTADDMRAAKEIKVLFTGDLSRKIMTNPFYFKTEKEYLRVVIARISFSTTLVPKGVYKTTEDNANEIEENLGEETQKVTVPTTDEMCKAANWVHFTKNVLKCNRLTHQEPVLEDPEADIEEEKKKIEARDPYEPRLKPITKDAKVKGGYSAWSIRQHGDTTVYAPANPAYALQNYSVVVVKCNFWPGAYTFFSEGQWSQIYVGDGLKHEPARFFPLSAPAVCSDPEDYQVRTDVSPGKLMRF